MTRRVFASWAALCALSCDGAGGSASPDASADGGAPADVATSTVDAAADVGPPAVDSAVDGSPADAVGPEPDAGPLLPGLGDLAPGWNELRPGGETICGDGSPWAFYVRRGTVDRLVIEFQGGGSCQSEQTCFVDQLATITHRPDADFADEAANAGLHDHGDPRNPVADWHHVLVSYCTADHHWGDHVARYGDRDFHHKGAVNTLTALAWAFRNVPHPEKVLVTGRSAGVFGSILGAAWVAHQYPEAAVYQLGDSAVTGGDRGFPAGWHLNSHLPPELADADPARGTAAMYRALAAAFPELRAAEISTAFDGVMSYYNAYYFHESARVWSAQARATLDALDAELPHHASYLAPGAAHVFESRLDFYTTRVAGVQLSAWVGRLVAGEALETVKCDPDCGAPLFGDAGAPEEWACLEAGRPDGVPEGPTAELALRLIAGDWTPAGGVPLAVCGAERPECPTPTFEGVTDAAGAIAVTVPTPAGGFTGDFVLTAADGTPNRLVFRPAITGPWHQLASADAWMVMTAPDIAALAEAFGQRQDPNLGAVMALTLDCAGSGTAQVQVDFGGRPPDGYYDPTRGLNTVGGVIAYALNVEPGTSTLGVTRDAGGPSVTTQTVRVDPGGYTTLLGLGP